MIRRVVVLPVKISGEVIQSIWHICANNAFLYGASFDSALCKLIIDAREPSTD